MDIYKKTMRKRDYIQINHLTDKDILWPNFAGKPSGTYNSTEKNFNIEVPDSAIPMLEGEGIEVKSWTNRDGVPVRYIRVKISWPDSDNDYYQTHVWYAPDDQTDWIEFGENDIHQLDTYYATIGFEQVDLELSTWVNKKDGKTKLFVSRAYFVGADDDFASDHRRGPASDSLDRAAAFAEELPFEE